MPSELTSSSMSTPVPFVVGAVGEDVGRRDQALAVLQEGLGQGFINRERLLWYAAAHAGRPFRSALAATDMATGQVVGALIFEIVDAQALRASFLEHFERVSADATIGPLLQSGTAGLIKSIAVSSAYRGRGVATALIQHGLRLLAEHGATQFYSLAWVGKQQGCALCGVLSALGFRCVRQIERFWYDDSVQHGYICPDCGNPCVCSVQVMIR